MSVVSCVFTEARSIRLLDQGWFFVGFLENVTIIFKKIQSQFILFPLRENTL